VFAVAAVGGVGGLIEGDATQFGKQLVGIGAAFGYSLVMTFAILKVLDLVMGLRVSREEEEMGIDASQHGERGYAFDVGGPGSVGIPQPAESMASIAPVGQGALTSVPAAPGGAGS
jgi:hypothetical protein